MPEDLAVVGVDNVPEAAHFWPSLTTVRQRLRASGALAVQELDHLIQGVGPASHAAASVSLLQPELVVRESSRQPVSK